MEPKVIKVARTSDPKKVAGSTRYYVTKNGECELHAVGPQAISIVTKALALLTCIFKFKYVSTVDYIHFTGKNGKKHTGLKFVVKVPKE